MPDDAWFRETAAMVQSSAVRPLFKNREKLRRRLRILASPHDVARLIEEVFRLDDKIHAVLTNIEIALLGRFERYLRHSRAEALGPGCSHLISAFQTDGRFNRSDFYEWLAQGGPSLKGVLAFLRHPSLSKRLFSKALLARCKGRLPWLSNRLLHAFAFRPRAFRELYKVVRIPKGQGRARRTLCIPSRPLRIVQRIILKELLDPACNEMLPRPVFGFRYPGQDFTIFRNAERHAVGTRLFASYDLKDFFPSVTTNQVVKALRRLPPHSTYRAFSESEKTDFEWASNDLVALLSRLTTHKGRLPQGAPTSPALASLAFVPCDRKIMGAISQHGQLRSTEYTRYGDDLTFSIPLARFASAKEFQAAVNQVLTSSLTGTGFELNPKKTRAGDSRTGFHVTGLLVRNRKIDLPRSQKRRLRQLCHQLRSSSLIDTAHRLRWLKADEQAARWLGRRLRSQVRFFAAAGVDLLRYKCPELSIEDLRATSEDGGPTYPELIQPRKWQIVRRLLCYAWEGRVRARMDAMDCQIEGPDGEPVVLLHGNENLALFTLGGREALMALISWKHCRGLESFLRAAPLSTQTTNFQSFGWWSLRLHEALLATPIFRVAPEPAPSRPQASGAPLVILWEEELRPRIARMVGAYRELCRELGVEPGETSAIERPPERNGLRAWLVTLVDILRSVPRIPRRAEGALKAVIHLADWAGGERHDDYPDLQELLHSCGLQDTSSGPSSIDAIVHRHLVERLYLDLHNLAPVGSEEMVDSPWHLPPGERLRSEVEKLIRLLEELAARDALVCEWHEEDSDHLASLITDSKMEENWRHICRSAHILYLWTIENRAGRPTPGKTNKKLQYIAKLRHRFAHGFMSFTHENLSDWLEAQRVCSRNLERNWKPEADPSTRVRLLEPALDLRLSSIEASELKIRLVAYCVEVLQEELQEIESQGREK